MKRPLSFLSLLPFLLFACKKDGTRSCLKASGERVHKERRIEGVRAIEIHDHIELLIEKSRDEGVAVQAGKKLEPLIETKRIGDTLVIRDLNRCHWLRSYDAVPKVTVRTSELENLENHGTADIHMEGSIGHESFLYEQWNGMGDVELELMTDSAELKIHSGSGRLTCQGKSDHVYAYLASSGFLKLGGLEAQNAFAWNKGTGNIRLHVKEELQARVESLGSIFYSGPGELTGFENSGSGRIVQKDD